MSALAVVLLALSGTAASSGTSPEAFAPGQVWTYDTRPGEENSTLTIVAIERVKGELPIVFVTVKDLRVHIVLAPGARKAIITRLESVPVTEAALRGSVKKLVRTDTPPAKDVEYMDWHLLGGTVYNSSVAEAVAEEERLENH